MHGVRVATMVLVIVGAINWGLIGFFDYNLIGDIFGKCGCGTARAIYMLIGVAGVLAAYRFICKCCNDNCKCCGKVNCSSKKK